MPGDVVTISGTGWIPGETLDIIITEEPVIHPPHTFTALVDGSGNFINKELVIQDVHLGQKFFCWTVSGIIL